MSSINTNTSAMNALTTLRSVNKNLATTQDRIGSGLKISSAKDNAAYFSISSTMKGDSGMYAAIDEGLTLTKNSLTVARKGAEEFVNLTKQFAEKISFAQTESMDRASVQLELDELVKQMDTVIKQSTFNGESWVSLTATEKGVTGAVAYQASAPADATDPGNVIPAKVATLGTSPISVVTGVTRGNATFDVTNHKLNKVDLDSLKGVLDGIDISPANADLPGTLKKVQEVLKLATTAATTLGLNEKTIETQQEFLKTVVDTLDTGVGAMVDADMEAEAARLQALQTQQQLATQALSVANQGPSNLMSLFR